MFSLVCRLSRNGRMLNKWDYGTDLRQRSRVESVEQRDGRVNPLHGQHDGDDDDDDVANYLARTVSN